MTRLDHVEDGGWTSRVRLLFCSIVLALLAGLFSAAPAVADRMAPAPFPPDSRYSAALTTRIANYNSNADALASEGAALQARIDDHDRRWREHLRKLDQYPGRKAPPAIARQLNVEAAAGNAEQAQLRAEMEVFNTVFDRLTAERAAIAAAAQGETNARVRANPPPHTAPQPGNQHAGPVRPQSPNAAANQSAPPKQSAPPSLEKVAALKKSLLDQDGKPFGREDDPGVYLISSDQLQAIYRDLLQKLGPSRIVSVQGGPVELWKLGTNCSINYRFWSSSSSDDPTIGVNIPGIPMKKYHVER